MASIRIIEVGPRDGLQNEKTLVPTADKLAYIHNLKEAGLREIEASSFVSPKWVPQLGDAEQLWPSLPSGPAYSALVPNLRGLERAMSLGVTRIAVFTAASESFTKANINMTIAESIAVFQAISERFRASQQTGHSWVRAYVSTVFECPYEGRVPHESVLRVCEDLLLIGVDEISLGDTIGVAVPSEVRALGKSILGSFPTVDASRFAWHFHDTRGTALANASAALDLGFAAFDASAGGLGGCPYAPGAGGNLATEDLIYWLERSGLSTGVDLDRLSRASLDLLDLMGRAPGSKAQLASLSLSQECSAPR